MKITSTNLEEIDRMELDSPHGEMIWKGNKKLIIKSEELDIVGKTFYLTQDNKAYGIIQIRSCEPINPKQFKEYEDLHKLSEKESKELWKGKKQLFAYQFDLISRYNEPTELSERGIEGLPFAGYKNFADCVKKTIAKKGWKKDRASGYCAAIARKVGEMAVKPPEPGTLPISAKKILDSAYENCRKQYPKYSKTRCSKIAWGAVKNAGWSKIDGVWKKSETKSATLDLRSKIYVLRFIENYKRVAIRPLQKFKGVKVEYGYDDETGLIKIVNLHFCSKLWDKKKILIFMRKYGKEVLGYKFSDHKRKLFAKHERGLEVMTVKNAITETLANIKMPLEINFTALKPGIFNGVYYSEEELKKACKSLEGKDLTIDHGKSVRDVIGKVTKINWNDILKQMEGSAQILDEDIAKKVKDKLITGVSVEVMVDYFKGEHGLSAKDAEFIALSIVKDPACKTCLIKPS